MRMGLFETANIHSVAKYQKIEGGKFSEQNHKAEKRGTSHSADRSGKRETSALE